MDKVGRVLLLFWQLYCGNSINKEAFCFEMDIDRRTFDRDIAAVRNFLAESYSGREVIFEPKGKFYYMTGSGKRMMTEVELTAITNPTVNSYKRLAPARGNTAPTHATWGLRNRAAMIRIPIYKPGKQLSTRIELRSPDPMANPYLVNAVTLETLSETARCFALLGIDDTDMVQLSCTRTRNVGSYHMMDAQNPVWVMSGEARRG